jgi:DNA mismatch repair protein MLH3
MFGDLLSRQDCQALIDSVATCAFPFQCAHGTSKDEVALVPS